VIEDVSAPFQIEPGERVLAVVGVRAVISRKVETVTETQLRRIAPDRFDGAIREKARALVRGQLEATFPEPPSYRALLEDLTKALRLDQVEAMAAALPDGGAFVSSAARAFTFLQGALPKSVAPALAGAVSLDVSGPEYHRFCSVLAVLDDPLSVFGLMGGGALLRLQAQAVRQLYPTLSAAIDQAITEATVDERAKDPTFQLGHLAEMGVRDWKGLPVVVAPYQSIYIAGARERDAKPQPSRAGVAPESKASLTAAQGALYGTVGR
jgi:hypothetical protein